MQRFFEEVVYPFILALGLSMIGMYMMLPDLEFQQNGQPPLSSAQPGFPEGGGLPTDFNIPTLVDSLGLAPSGTTPVAVFPPWAT